jgi:hypothetical protein
LIFGTGASTGTLTLKIAPTDRRLRASAVSITKHKLQLLQGWHVLFSFQRTSNENRRAVTPIGASSRQGSLNPFPCEASAIIPTISGAASESRKYLRRHREWARCQRNCLDNRELGRRQKERAPMHPLFTNPTAVGLQSD